MFPSFIGHKSLRRPISHNVSSNAIYIKKAADLADLKADIWRHMHLLQLCGGLHQPLPQLILLLAGFIAEIVWVLKHTSRGKR